MLKKDRASEPRVVKSLDQDDGYGEALSEMTEGGKSTKSDGKKKGQDAWMCMWMYVDVYVDVCGCVCGCADCVINTELSARPGVQGVSGLQNYQKTTRLWSTIAAR